MVSPCSRTRWRAAAAGSWSRRGWWSWPRSGSHGVEVDHPDHDPEDRELLRRLAAEHGLVTTGSSDYHGTNKTTPIAAETTDPAAFEKLVAQATGVPVPPA